MKKSICDINKKCLIICVFLIAKLYIYLLIYDNNNISNNNKKSIEMNKYFINCFYKISLIEDKN